MEFSIVAFRFRVAGFVLKIFGFGLFEVTSFFGFYLRFKDS